MGISVYHRALLYYSHLESHVKCDLSIFIPFPSGRTFGRGRNNAKHSRVLHFPPRVIRMGIEDLGLLLENIEEYVMEQKKIVSTAENTILFISLKPVPCYIFMIQL